jgi:hypothetical protein
MSSWKAETDQAQFDRGTIISVFMSPIMLPGSGIAPKGAQITVRFTSGATTQIEVVENYPTEAIMRTSDGTEWRMVRVDPKALPFPPADTGGAPTSHWRVADRIPFPSPQSN